MPGSCLGVNDRAGARRQGQRRAPVATGERGEHRVTHHTGQAPGNPLSPAK
jgi:hypothetical protein